MVGGQLGIVWDDFGSLANANPPADIVWFDRVQDGGGAFEFDGSNGDLIDAVKADPDAPTTTNYKNTVTIPVGTNITGIPTTLTLNIDRLPKVQLGVDPVNLNLAISEFPSLRVHLPADFRVGLSLLGMELLNVRLCGQAMAITEPYKPNPCEICGPRGDADGAGLQRLTLGDG